VIQKVLITKNSWKGNMGDDKVIIKVLRDSNNGTQAYNEIALSDVN